jgi:hypothetical protein
MAALRRGPATLKPSRARPCPASDSECSQCSHWPWGFRAASGRRGGGAEIDPRNARETGRAARKFHKFRLPWAKKSLPRGVGRSGEQARAEGVLKEGRIIGEVGQIKSYIARVSEGRIARGDARKIYTVPIFPNGTSGMKVTNVTWKRGGILLRCAISRARRWVPARVGSGRAGDGKACQPVEACPEPRRRGSRVAPSATDEILHWKGAAPRPPTH